MDAFQVSEFRFIPGFDQGLERRLHQCGHTPTEHGLLAEQIGFGLHRESGRDDSGTGRADAGGPGERRRQSLAAGVPFHRYQRGQPFALHVESAQQRVGALGSHHDDVHAVRRVDQSEANVEPVDEAQRLAGSQ